ncbi:MAG: hypothetical protein A2Y25_03560 [Candidatus Melainabacteria bacterium GWF2_37_15]|nr:MAG: hypothetical protein A2Y25_03560 [Candidatus Melainabacteria bacterium GWF2_37_15]
MSSLAKVTVSGQVVKSPEKRFTEGNLAITSFMMDFGFEGQEKLIRVFTIGKLADRIADTIKKGQSVIVDGRLQTTTKNEAGVDKKITEINAQGIEIIEKSSQSYQQDTGGEDEVSSEDLIGEDEIPF